MIGNLSPRASFKVRIQSQGANGPEIWYATSPVLDKSPEKTILFLNKTAKRRGMLVTYSLATQEQYDAYKANGGAK